MAQTYPGKIQPIRHTSNLIITSLVCTIQLFRAKSDQLDKCFNLSPASQAANLLYDPRTMVNQIRHVQSSLIDKI